MWQQLLKFQEDDSATDRLGVSANRLKDEMDRSTRIRVGTDHITDIAKLRLFELGESLSRSDVDICRLVASELAGDKTSDLQPLVERVESAILDWRSTP